MSLPVLRLTDAATSFPRVSGDEPLAGPHLFTQVRFSPRERG